MHDKLHLCNRIKLIVVPSEKDDYESEVTKKIVHCLAR